MHCSPQLTGMGNPTQVTSLGLSLSRAADIRLSVGHLSCLSPRAGHRPSTLRVQPWVVRGEAEMAEVWARAGLRPTGRQCRRSTWGGRVVAQPQVERADQQLPIPLPDLRPWIRCSSPVPEHGHPSALERSEHVVVGVAQGAGGLRADGPLLVSGTISEFGGSYPARPRPPLCRGRAGTAGSRPACGSWIPSGQPSAAWRSVSGERRRGTLRPGDEPDQRISVTRCSLNAAQLEFSTDTYTLAMLPPQLTQWALP